MDLLDDILLEPSAVKAPAGSKFQPKAKPRPKKVSSSIVSSLAAKVTKEQPVTVIPADSFSNQSVEQNDLVEKKLQAPSSSSFTNAEIKETSFNKEATYFGSPPVDGNIPAEGREAIGLTFAGNSKIEVSKPSGDGDLITHTSSGLQSPDNIVGKSTTIADMPVEKRTQHASNRQNEEGTSVFPAVSFASDSPFRSCSSQLGHDLSLPSLDKDPGSFVNAFVSNAEDYQIETEQGAEDFSSVGVVEIMSEAANASGRRAVKFQPKPKAQSGRERYGAGDDCHLPNASEVPSGDGYVDGGDLDQGGEFGQRKTSNESNSSHEFLDGRPSLSSCQTNEIGYEFLDGVDDGVHYNSSSPAKAPDESPTNGHEKNKGDDEEALKKKKPRKSKTVANEMDKPARKRKKPVDACKQSSDKPREKFPHATRRKRCVDKSLLEAPEDEIDLQRVPIRDLIILAEYKERQAKKDAVKPPLTNERTGNTLSEETPYDDDDTFNFDQDRGSFDNPSTSGVLKDTSYFNYQSFMDRTPKVRWSKQDTELFYQGVRQFGSDLSMIQQLFPGRTRRQIKLKYKKEEREHPMMLHDALTSRAKDLSHFEMVMERLQEQAAQEEAEQNQDDAEDASAHTTVEEGPEEESLGTHAPSNEEAAKRELNEEGSAADQEPDTVQVESPAKYYASEDDFNWSEYRSEL